jgi:hypothetical protein
VTCTILTLIVVFLVDCCIFGFSTMFKSLLCGLYSSDVDCIFSTLDLRVYFVAYTVLMLIVFSVH